MELDTVRPFGKDLKRNNYQQCSGARFVRAGGMSPYTYKCHLTSGKKDFYKTFSSNGGVPTAIKALMKLP